MPPASLRSPSTSRRIVTAAVRHPLAVRPAEDRAPRGLVVEMERLRIELSGEGLAGGGASCFTFG
jgi:hypothetical protein